MTGITIPKSIGNLLADALNEGRYYIYTTIKSAINNCLINFSMLQEKEMFIWNLT